MSLKKSFKDWYGRLRFRMSANNHPLFIGHYKYLYFPKEGSLGYFLDLYSKHKNRKVTVLQVGANDGINHDPIHKFIKRDRWGGILLEPQREVFEQFLTKVYQKNPNIKTVNAAMGHEDGFLTVYKVAFSNQRWATGLTSFSKEVMEENFESGYVFREAKLHGIAVPERKEDWITEEKVEMISMKTLLKKYPVGKIDLVQIDVEGFDFEIIKMIDFKELDPEIISYERTHFSEETVKECAAFLQSKGYALRNIGRNTLAVKTGITALTDLFKTPEKALKR